MKSEASSSFFDLKIIFIPSTLFSLQYILQAVHLVFTFSSQAPTLPLSPTS